MSNSMTKFGKKSTSNKSSDRSSVDKFQTQGNSSDGGVGIFTYSTKPDASIFGKKSINLESFVEMNVESCEDAANCPDLLQIIYNFKFPEACEQFKKIFSTDVVLLDSYHFTQGSSNAYVTVNGFSNYVLRCPFIPKCLSISLLSDASAYTVPVVEVPADVDSTPPGVKADGPTNAESIVGRVVGNGIFRHGYPVNYIRQFILMGMGIRVEFNCDNVIVDKPLSAVGVQCLNLVTEGVQGNDTPLVDLQDLNIQLANMKYPTRFVHIDNAQGVCNTDVLEAAHSPQVPQIPANACINENQCLPLPCVPLMQGMGLNIVLYTMPGMASFRDAILSQACIETVNPGNDLPPGINATSLTVLWTGTNPLHIIHHDSVTTISQNQPIPLDLLVVEQTTPGVPGTFTVKTRFSSQVAATFNASNPFDPPGTTLTTVVVNHTQYEVGSSEQKVINHGCLQIICNIYGCYIRRSDLMDYFCKYAVNNHHLRTLMLETREVRDILDLMARDQWKKLGVSKIEAAAAGVGALPELKKLAKSDNDGENVNNDDD